MGAKKKPVKKKKKKAAKKKPVKKKKKAAKVKDAFSKLDKNHDGKITRNELDKNKDGKVSKKEISDVVKGIKSAAKKKETKSSAKNKETKKKETKKKETKKKETKKKPKKEWSLESELAEVDEGLDEFNEPEKDKFGFVVKAKVKPTETTELLDAGIDPLLVDDDVEIPRKVHHRHKIVGVDVAEAEESFEEKDDLTVGHRRAVDQLY